MNLNCRQLVTYFLARSLVLLSTTIAIVTPTGALADSSSPLLAAYYDRQMAIVNGVAYGWQGNDRPQQIATDAKQVGVGRNAYYVLNSSNELLSYKKDLQKPNVLMSSVAKFAAGRTGVLAINSDGVLWWIDHSSSAPTKIANNVDTAAVGDSANYYITKQGALFVKGKAHRGQYGDGRLKSTDTFIQTASNVSKITAHTGHAILLNKDGDVLGTGGNIFGPVGKHGLGDKAIRWSKIMSGSKAIATGSSHTLAIDKNNELFAWGSEYGVEPVRIMKNVKAVAAGSSTTIALMLDNTLLQWARGDIPKALSQD
ncbi:MAG: hypothetical protein ABJK39_01735 [Hyphomicrobiales bacterium]